MAGVLKYHNGSSWVPVSFPTATESSDGVIKVANNLTTTNSGYALDARQGKILSDKIDNLSQGVESRTVLWTNANPTSDFAQQDVSIPNFGDYDFYVIQYKIHSSYSHTVSTGYIPKGSGVTLIGAKNLLCNRDCTWYSSAIGFANSLAWTSYNGADSTILNSYNVPIRIYGIKKVVS